MRIKCALALVFVAFAPAFAQTQRVAPKVRYEQKTRIDVTEDESVTGTTASGDGLMVDGRRPPRHTSLIRVRTDFVPEMVQSAERF